MTQKEINTGTQLIQELMGSTIKIDQKDVKDIPLAFLKSGDMKFHTSWKWLMPVVIKIEEDLGHSVLIKNSFCRIAVDDDTVFENEADSKLEAIWYTIIDFLKWNKENS